MASYIGKTKTAKTALPVPTKQSDKEGDGNDTDALCPEYWRISARLGRGIGI
jgi:hypothetical protein